ncbi:hypothetical protein MA20_31925 [Bradyrhizobium japonicum]|uniref:SGNH hydrolase-type esterase domain-containing protein n=1 Tax=Bradyrhizobium japonicum TaxID=375 RepID=A0A0A3YQ35_BRAJP|nr:SGNH/GDSL hydrolase family protein [Bradyrhizobium japonicum]KGT75803.1 hypothetical protein MA20_31925 [Bradyrhizobium japonicum]
MEIPNITFSVGNQTYYLRQECEAPFDAVRIRVWNTIAAPTGVFSAVVASTETTLRDTASNKFEPISGGAPFNSVVTSGPGWRAVTWGGAAVSGSAGAGNATATYVESDWVIVPSLNRADGSARPLLLVRLFANGSAAGANYSGTQIVGDRYDIDYSRVYELGVFGGDGVTTLTNEPTNYFRSSASALSPLVSIEFRYRGNVVAISIINGGDSVTGGVQSNGSQVGDGQDGWQQRAILGVSTPDAPFTFMNVGQSGQTSSTFMPALTSVLNSGVRPDYIFIPTGSRNDGYGSNSIADTYFTRVDALIALCATLAPKPKIVMWNDVPLYNATHGGNATVDATQAYALTLAQARLAAGSIFAIVDTYDAVALGSPAVWDTADNLHPASGSVEPTRPATPLMAATFKAFLRPSFGPIITRPASSFAGISFAQVNSACIVRPAQVSGSGTITRHYQWKLAGVNVGTDSVISPTWASGDIGKVPTCVETVSGVGPNVSSTATFQAVTAAVTNGIATSNAIGSFTSVTDLTFTQDQTDPFGNANTAWTVTEGTASAAHAASQVSLMNYTLNTVYTTSMYVKAGGATPQTAFQMMFDSARFGASAYANFDYLGGSGGCVTTVGAGLISARMRPCEEVPGWYRCEITAQCTSGGTGRSIFKMSNSNGAARLAGYVGASKTQVWYNAQTNAASSAQANVVT